MQLCYAPPPPALEEEAEESANADEWPVQLFGVHVVDAAADLLLAQMHNSSIQQSQQQQQQGGSGASGGMQGSTPQQQQQGLPFEGGSLQRRSRKHSSSTHHMPGGSTAAVLDLWDEYATRLPRSNKQYRQLMQQQWEQQLQGARAGSIGVLQPDALLLAAAKADQAAYQQGPCRPRGAVLADEGLAGQPWEQSGDSAAQLVQQVLQTVGLDLSVYQQRLQKLQGSVLH
jgi:hypothetical protein